MYRYRYVGSKMKVEDKMLPQNFWKVRILLDSTLLIFRSHFNIIIWYIKLLTSHTMVFWVKNIPNHFVTFGITSSFKVTAVMSYILFPVSNALFACYLLSSIIHPKDIAALFTEIMKFRAGNTVSDWLSPQFEIVTLNYQYFKLTVLPCMRSIVKDSNV